MLIRVRQWVFYLFVGLYLLLCPWTMLYALGYLVTPDPPGFVKTGLISLSTVPAGATVFLEHRRYTHVTPTILRDLVPGEYTVRLIIPGHAPWDRTVRVEAEKATILERVLLLPDEPVVEEILSLATETSPFHGARVRAVLAAGETPAVLLQVETDEGERALWAQLGGLEARVADLTALFAQRPLRVEWDPRAPRDLFAFRDGTLSRLDTAAFAIDPFPDRLLGFGVSQRRLYVLREDGHCVRLDREGRAAEPMGWFLLPDDGLQSGRGPGTRVTVLSGDTMLALSPQGELWVNQPPYTLAAGGVRGMVADPARERVLIWQRDRVGVVAMAQHVPTVTWAPYEGRHLTQAFWVYDGSHLLLHDGDALVLLEWDTAGAPRARTLRRVGSKHDVVYAEATGKYYYVDRTARRLLAVTLLDNAP